MQICGALPDLLGFCAWSFLVPQASTYITHPQQNPLSMLINPRRACAARVTVVVLSVRPSVRLSVRLCVQTKSRTTGYEAAYERYQQLQCHKGLKNNVAILLKPLRSGDMA